jgi:hypothetical protein
MVAATFRCTHVELPGLNVAKGIADDARVRVSMPRSFFNVMA